MVNITEKIKDIEEEMKVSPIIAGESHRLYEIGGCLSSQVILQKRDERSKTLL